MKTPVPFFRIEAVPDWFPTACLLFVAWALAVFQLRLEWSINPEYQYGWVVPVLTLLLWWRAWIRRPSGSAPVAGRTAPLLIGLVAILAVPIRIIQEANPEWRALNDFFAIQAVLITALVVDSSGGRTWLRHFAFPLLFPLVAVPWPSTPEFAIIQGLQRCVAAIGVEGASWLGWNAFQSGNLIVLPNGTVGISEACSGIRSLQTSLMISLFLGDYFQLSTSHRWALLAFAILAALVLNIARAFLLIVIMGLYGSGTVRAFHDPAGAVLALGCLIWLWFAANLLAPPPMALSVAVPARAKTFPPRWCLILFVAWTTAELVNQAWYLAHERNLVPAPVWTLRWPPPRPGFKEEPVDETARIYLRFDQGWHGKWKDLFQWEVFFFTWNPGAATAGLAQNHRPDICLPAAGFVMKEQRGVKNIEVNGLVLPVARFVFQDPLNGRLYYVFQVTTNDRVWKDPVTMEGEGINVAYRLKTAWAGRRNPGQRSLLLTNQGAKNLEEAEAAFRQWLQDSLVVSP